jgi:hypothetical protein
MSAKPLRFVPLDQLHQLSRETMQKHFLAFKSVGRTRAGSPEGFYGFRAEDVIEMHFHQNGFGRGVWYRLKDGRVINVLGQEAPRDRAWYVASTH